MHQQRRLNKEPCKVRNPFTCQSSLFSCGKVGHFKKDCKVKRETNNLNVSVKYKGILCESMLNTSESESMSDLGIEDDIKQIQYIDENSSQTSSEQERKNVLRAVMIASLGL